MRAIFVFYVDSNLRFDKLKYRPDPSTPITGPFWTKTPYQLENFFNVPGGYLIDTQGQNIVAGQAYYAKIAVESCEEVSEILELSTTTAPYTGDPYSL